jgi:hypothetical protein
MSGDLCERLNDLEQRLKAFGWLDPVPDDLQSDIRMEFNEALAGGPNMNGDAGPTLTVNHALDCIFATRRIAEQAAHIECLQAQVEDAAAFIRDLATTDTIILAETLEAKADALIAALNATPQRAPQPSCEHNWQFRGTDRHGSRKGEKLYLCTKCGDLEYDPDTHGESAPQQEETRP